MCIGASNLRGNMNCDHHQIIHKTVNMNLTKMAEKRKTIDMSALLASTEMGLGSEKFELYGGYRVFVRHIEALMQSGTLKPVKSSGWNGMTPVLYQKYRYFDSSTSSLGREEQNELLSFHPRILKDYYLKHPKDFQKDRTYLLALNHYLNNPESVKALGYRATANERSFEIFRDEKFLEGRGTTVINRVGLDLEALNSYRVYEAFFHMWISPGQPGDALIIENKDTFMSLTRALIREKNKGCRPSVNLLIYGEGNKITGSFGYMHEITQDVPVERILYFGDLDYAGIHIYQNLASRFPQYDIKPNTGLYKSLVESVEDPPRVRSDYKTDIQSFLEYFTKEDSLKIRSILEKGKFIPQEGLCFAKGTYGLS